MAKAQSKPKSPYAKYAKAPYAYSELLQRWQSQVRRTGSNLTADALDLDAAFRRRERLPPRKPTDPTLYDEFGGEYLISAPRAQRSPFEGPGETGGTTTRVAAPPGFPFNPPERTSTMSHRYPYNKENESLAFNPETVAVGICNGHDILTGAPTSHEVIFQTNPEGDPEEWRWLTTEEKASFAQWREQGGHFLDIGEV